MKMYQNVSPRSEPSPRGWPSRPGNPTMTQATSSLFRASVLADPTVLAPYFAADREIARRYFLSEVGIPLQAAQQFLATCVDVISIDSQRDGTTRGAVAVTSVDTVSHHCFLSAFRFNSGRRSRAFGGILLGIDLVFTRWDLHRIRFDVVAFNLPQFASVARYVDHEGVRKDWVWLQGRYWDAHLFSVDRSTWATRVRPRLPRLA
jgi:hypothetical protein